MRIYVAHSKKLDYVNGLYRPIRESNLNAQHEIVFPHEDSDSPCSSKQRMRSFDMMIAEVTHTSNGLIELG
ncbi:MAG: hypothetical protein ACE5DM_03600 [Candidatus Nanoarchaeia archaeon]